MKTIFRVVYHYRVGKERYDDGKTVLSDSDAQEAIDKVREKVLSEVYEDGKCDLFFLWEVKIISEIDI